MARFFKKRNKTRGAAPGTPVFIGSKKIENMLIRIMDYDSEVLQESQPDDIPGLTDYNKSGTVSWINFYGLHDVEKIRQIGQQFNLHPLIIEDIVNTDQRPKIEEYDNCLFITLKMLQFDEQEKVIFAEQLSMVITEHVLLTFQERKSDFFEPVRERIRRQKGRIRKSDTDYLTYALLDTVVDNYIFLIERIGEEIENLEAEVLDNPSDEILENIKYYKREMIFLRKNIRPAKECISQLARKEFKFINEATLPFLSDLLDLITHTADVLDTYRDILSDLLNIYHTNISSHLNDVMRVLTVFAAIFIPLTFIAGIYGTNFEYLPELHYKYAYYVFLGAMGIIAVAMLIFFKHKKWI